MLTDLPLGEDNIERRKTQRKNVNVPYKNSLESATRGASTERKRLKKTFFLFLRTNLRLRYITQINYTEIRKTKRKKEKGLNLNSLGSAARAPGDCGI
jgi:hypothetical protein